MKTSTFQLKFLQRCNLRDVYNTNDNHKKIRALMLLSFLFPIAIITDNLNICILKHSIKTKSYFFA